MCSQACPRRRALAATRRWRVRSRWAGGLSAAAVRSRSRCCWRACSGWPTRTWAAHTPLWSSTRTTRSETWTQCAPPCPNSSSSSRWDVAALIPPLCWTQLLASCFPAVAVFAGRPAEAVLFGQHGAGPLRGQGARGLHPRATQAGARIPHLMRCVLIDCGVCLQSHGFGYHMMTRTLLKCRLLNITADAL